MKYLSVVKGIDYALSLVHYIRKGRRVDCIVCLDDDSDRILTEYNIEHRLEDEIINVYISKVIYTMRYQRETNEVVCYHDVFVNFDDYEGLEDFMKANEFTGLLVADREIYWPGVENSFLPICKCMFAFDIPENAESEYLERVTTTEDSIYRDFTYSYYNDSWEGWYSHNLNGFADDEITLELNKDRDWYCKDNWLFWDIKKYYEPNYINAGHDLLYMNIFSGNDVLNIDRDLFERYSVTDIEALKRVAYKVEYKMPEVETIKIIE